MRAEERPDGLHTALARSAWDQAPSARLYYHCGDDSLVVEFAQADEVAEIEVYPHLVVDLDGTDPGKRPTTLYLTGVRTDPDSPAVRLAREILGAGLWAAAEALVVTGTGVAEVDLAPDEGADRVLAWRGMGQWWVPAMIGVEFTPGRVYAVLTSARGILLDEEIVDLSRNDPNAVVAAIADAGMCFARRHPGTAAGSCPVAVQLGGPVHTPTGMVEFYNKPLHPDDESWMGVPLGAMITEVTGREASVFNDARALAEYEIETGLGRELPKVVVLIVRNGVGAKLIHHGRVAEDFPMEIGIFLDDGFVGPEGGRRTIEATSGVAGIIEDVERVCRRPVGSLVAAAEEAQNSDVALQIFWRAGCALARGVAAVQAVLNPDRWVLYGPVALVDGIGMASRAFLQGVGNAHDHLGYDGLWPSLVVARSTTGSLGAVAACAAARRVGRSALDGGRSARVEDRGARDEHRHG